MLPFADLLTRAARRALTASVLLHGAGIAAVVLGVVAVRFAPQWDGDRRAPAQLSLAVAEVNDPTPPSELPPPAVTIEPSEEPPPVEPIVPLPEAAAEPTDEGLLPAPPPPSAQRPPRPEELTRPLRATAAKPAAVAVATEVAPEPAAATPAAPTGADVEPSPLPGQNAPPTYPWVAWRRGIAGTVTVVLEIDRAGAVLAAHVVTSSGSSLLDDAALQALAQWRFPAAGLDRPAVRTHRQDVAFVLTGR